MTTVEQPVEKRFLFNGSAVAFGAVIRRPSERFINSVASSNLPVIGGFAEAEVKDEAELKKYYYDDLIRFTYAYSRAKGDFTDPQRAAEFTYGNQGENLLPTITIVEAKLQGLSVTNAGHFFFAQTLAVHSESGSDRRGPISFRSLTPTFAGISYRPTPQDTTPIGITITTAHDVFSEYDTKEKLMKAYAESSDFRKEYASLFLPPGEHERGGLSGLLCKHEIPNAAKGPIVATFVTKITFDGGTPKGVEVLGNRVTIQDYGRIYFGEIVIEENMRRVTMLRFELGTAGSNSPVGSTGSEVPHALSAGPGKTAPPPPPPPPIGGDAAACEVVHNGTTSPP